MKQFISIALVLLVCCMLCYAKKKVDTNSVQNSVVENILNRKSVRKYSDKKVEQEKIDIILKAAMAAPSARNLQPWEIIVVTDRQKLEQLGNLLPKAVYTKDSQVTFIVCGNTEISDKFWTQDCSAVTENILLAAESLGLGAVWCAGYPMQERTDPIKQYFNLPDNIIPLSIVPMGYPLTQEAPKQKFNSQKIHVNKW